MELIDRYIYDVVRRLPEGEREEVRRELDTNITDMLPENPSEQDISDVINKMGAPSKLAEQYRQNSRYLISPALFDLYISTIKNVTVIVAIVCACVGVFIGIGSLDSNSSAGEIIGSILSNSISFAFEGALIALFWITLGFFIADKSGYKGKPWTAADLPQLPDKKTGVEIPRLGTVIGAAFSVIFLIIYIFLINNGYFFGGVISIRGTEIASPISQAALERSVPFAILLTVTSLILAFCKFLWGRWNVPVCVVNIISNIIGATVWIYIIQWKDLFNSNFLDFILKFTDDGGNFYETVANGSVYFLPVAIAIIILFTLIDIGVSVRNTTKGL